MSVETRTTLQPQTIKKLQDLIQVNIDSRDGFRHAAEKIENMTLSTYFQALALERDEQASELSRFVAANREDPRSEGSVAAALHRSWMTIRESLSSNNVYAVLAEAERGEDQIKQSYETALRETAGSAVNDVLTRQYAQVKAAHDRIRDLRDEHKAD
jgi:uncharacterized protein (TIGR02284 family)